nr:hypothetical protein B296_00053306 [Ipomoea trifida]
MSIASLLTAKMRLGMFPSRAMTWSLATASSLPTMSATLLGLYFSTHGMSGPDATEEDDAMDGWIERKTVMRSLEL